MPGHGSSPRTVMSALWRPPLILCPSSADLTASEKSSEATTESSPVPSSGTTVAQGCSLSTVSGEATRITPRFLRGLSTSMIGSGLLVVGEHLGRHLGHAFANEPFGRVLTPTALGWQGFDPDL